jgi:hypothetical protein
MNQDEALTLEALKYAASKGYGLTVQEMKIDPFTIKREEALAQPKQEPVHPDSARIDWLTNNPLSALDIFGHVKGADAVRWIRQEIDDAIRARGQA